MKLPHLVVSLISLTALPSCGDSRSVYDYDGCILQNMKGIESDLAARVVLESCEQKFPVGYDSRKSIKSLSELQLSKLEGEAKPQFPSKFGGEIYNGNEAITVTSVTIKLAVKDTENAYLREYNVNVVIPPKTTRHFSILASNAGTKSEFRWELLSANGFSDE